MAPGPSSGAPMSHPEGSRRKKYAFSSSGSASLSWLAAHFLEHTRPFEFSFPINPHSKNPRAFRCLWNSSSKDAGTRLNEPLSIRLIPSSRSPQIVGVQSELLTSARDLSHASRHIICDSSNLVFTHCWSRIGRPRRFLLPVFLP